MYVILNIEENNILAPEAFCKALEDSPVFARPTLEIAMHSVSLR